jgi:tetratricopeptide (TPR) repeat protein
MNINILKAKYIIIYFLNFFFAVNTFAQSSMEYADYLMNEKDYFRAISEYKRILYYADDIETKNECLLKISKSYLKSNQFKSSIRFSSRLLNQPKINIFQINKANTYIGLSYYGLRVFPIAEDYFKKSISSDKNDFSSFYLALLDVERGNYLEARKRYIILQKNTLIPELSIASEKLSNEVLNGLIIKRKNSFVSTFLSAIFPGSGQVYCEHYYDGIQAFAYVGVFSFATYASYKYDKKFNVNFYNTIIASSITALFHIGNIIGANRTASYYNMKQKQVFKDHIRGITFSIDY